MGSLLFLVICLLLGVLLFLKTDKDLSATDYSIDHRETRRTRFRDNTPINPLIFFAYLIVFLVGAYFFLFTGYEEQVSKTENHLTALDQALLHVSPSENIIKILAEYIVDSFKEPKTKSGNVFLNLLEFFGRFMYTLFSLFVLTLGSFIVYYFGESDRSTEFGKSIFFANITIWTVVFFMMIISMFR